MSYEIPESSKHCNCLIDNQLTLGPHHDPYCHFHAPVFAIRTTPVVEDFKYGRGPEHNPPYTSRGQDRPLDNDSPVRF